MVKVFTNIGELLTLKSAFKKAARNIKEGDLSIVKNAAMVSDSGKIIWVGKRSQLSTAIRKLNLKVNKEVDLSNAVVMPSFVECHTHSVFAGDRSHEFELRNRGVSYQEIARKGGGILSTVKATRRAKANQLLELLQSRVDNFVSQGVTTLEVKSGYGLNKKTELKMLKVIKQVNRPNLVSTYLGAHAVPKEFSSAAKYMDSLINNELPYLAKHKLADRVDVFIEDGYFTPELAKKYFEAAKKYGLSISAHTEQLNRTQGYKVAIQYDADSIDHVIQLTANDIKNISKSETTAVLLPGADFYLKVPYPKARKLIDSGARVALATDFNPGSCPTQDLSLIGVLARLEMKMSLPEVICAYTLGAAYALGMQQQVGSLQPGKSCDFVVLDQGWEQMFYQVGLHPITQTWWRGRKIF